MIRKEWIQEYQLFILCKIVASDIQLKEGSNKFSLSPPVEVETVWHEHLKRPLHYYKMCRLLLPNQSPENSLIDHNPGCDRDSKENKEMQIQLTREYMDLLRPEWEEIMNMENLVSKTNGTTAHSVGLQSLVEITQGNSQNSTTILTIKLKDANPFSDEQHLIELKLDYLEISIQIIKEKIFQLHKIPIDNNVSIIMARM
jgi:hypothetical protein